MSSSRCSTTWAEYGPSPALNATEGGTKTSSIPSGWSSPSLGDHPRHSACSTATARHSIPSGGRFDGSSPPSRSRRAADPVISSSADGETRPRRRCADAVEAEIAGESRTQPPLSICRRRRQVGVTPTSVKGSRTCVASLVLEADKNKNGVRGQGGVTETRRDIRLCVRRGVVWCKRVALTKTPN